jgi:Family of unknown function (DUF6624)
VRRLDAARTARESEDWIGGGPADEQTWTWLRTIVDRFGWPGFAAVGSDGAEVAYMLLQLAPIELRLHCLPLLVGAVLADDANPVNLAYLVDSILAADNRPQLFGTHYAVDGGQVIRCPVDDPARVTARQRRLGIDPRPPAHPRGDDGDGDAP